MDELREKVIKEVKHQIAWFADRDQEEIKLEDKLVFDLGLDSLDILEFSMELESKLDVEIDDDAAEAFVTVNDVVEFIFEKVKDKK